MFTIYIYILDTMADWELGHVISELHSGRFFKKDANAVSLKTVAFTKAQVKTMGGLTIVPDCLVDDIAVSETSVLLLPGANTWSDPVHRAVIGKAEELLSAGALVGAICGATVALADAGLLDKRHHTSNGAGFLKQFSACYNGQDYYINQPSVADENLITAGSTGALQWARHIIEHLGLFQANTLTYWYEYFSTGNPDYFYALMQSIS